MRLQYQSMLQTFFGALQRCSLPEEREAARWGLHQQVPLGSTEERLHLYRLAEVLIALFEGINGLL
jgi:hypothetical protein